MEPSKVCFHRTSKIKQYLNEPVLALSCLTRYFSCSLALYFRKGSHLFRCLSLICSELSSGPVFEFPEQLLASGVDGGRARVLGVPGQDVEPEKYIKTAHSCQTSEFVSGHRLQGPVIPVIVVILGQNQSLAIYADDVRFHFLSSLFSPNRPTCPL